MITNPWDYIKALFNGVELTEDDMGAYNPFFMNRLLSFDGDFRHLAYRVNKWFFIGDKLMHYRMLLGHLKGRSRRINYTKVAKRKEASEAYERLAEGFKSLFGWSRREMASNLWWMDKKSKEFWSLCSSVGLSEKEIKSLIKSDL